MTTNKKKINIIANEKLAHIFARLNDIFSLQILCLW